MTFLPHFSCTFRSFFTIILHIFALYDAYGAIMVIMRHISKTTNLNERRYSGRGGGGNVFLSHESKIIKIYKTVTQVQGLCRSNKKEEEKPLGFFSSFFFLI